MKFKINIENNTKEKFLFTSDFKNTLKALAKVFDINKDLEVDVMIVDNKTIQKLNKEYRQKDYATDILSFGFDDFQMYEKLPFIHLGELIISDEKVKQQALEFNHSLRREYCYLFAHGLVHLLGYDHEIEDERVVMNGFVDKIMEEVKIFRED
ncbi:rRNA maturation RNase YbeY [Mycoplasmopsis ciconiae]|uniref:Endoribonuclease YbeY n=1 Tax=Mycoplasmopsis ciconiae TaxID=561067 RepID=A0ABU7MLY3_9BACT|nr:rRNA maturation RNase YbeY [Mycoplasmopsis ciconiae]